MRNVVRRVVRRSGFAAAVAAIALSPWSSAAWGHGETTTTDPEAGASLKRAPAAVSVDLTEPPADGGRFTVTDGCGDEVSKTAKVDGNTLSTQTSKGEPGRWEASYKVVSSIDGHVTTDDFSFKVDGEKDCSPEEPKQEEEQGKGGDGPNAAGPNEDGEDDGGGLPMVPIAAGTIALLGIALVIRLRSAK